MTDNSVLVTLSGMLVMAYVVIALFFVRFYLRTKDRLHGIFAVSFGILSLQRLILSVAGAWSENSVGLYGLRLIAFVLLIVAIVDKNRGGATTR